TFGRKLKLWKPSSKLFPPKTKLIRPCWGRWIRNSIPPSICFNPSYEERADFCPQVHRPWRSRPRISRRDFPPESFAAETGEHGSADWEKAQTFRGLRFQGNARAGTRRRVF